jgi:hypothetical protein
MTADSTIRRALDDACRTDAFYGPGKGPNGYDEGLRQEYAEIIAAFLRACPVITDLPPGPDRMGFWDADARERWATAVEAAAGEQTP